MKKFICIIAALLILPSILCSCSKTEISTPAGMQLASVPAVDYYMYVPSDWTVASQYGITAAYVSSIDPSNVSCARYAITSSAVFETPVTGDETSEKAEITYAKNYWTDYVSQLQTLLPGFQIISGPSPVTLDGYAAIRVSYSTTLSGTLYKYDMVICVKDQLYAYILTFTSTDAFYEADLVYFNSILDEFVFQTGVFE